MKNRIKIGDKWIGKDEQAFIIAEVGSNHDKKLSQAKELIDIASDSRVDAVKFQLIKAESLYPSKEPMFTTMKENELPWEWVDELCEYARIKNIIFLASPFDKEGIDLLCEIGSPAFKWASSETVNLPLLRYAGAKRKPMLISTGMCNLADVYEAVEVVKSVDNQEIVLLHCTSLYPAEPRYINLRAMGTLRDAFRLPVGYSDHTLGFMISVAAIARGACVIEKHFTLSRKLKGPNHFYALEPPELKQMIMAIREVERSIGSAIKGMLPQEQKFARRNSLIAKQDIPRGTELAKGMIMTGRPASGIEPRFLETIIGQKTKINIKKNQAITWDAV